MLLSAALVAACLVACFATLFAAAFVGAVASGKTELEAAEIASSFTLESICNTCEQPAHWYGVKFEPALSNLIHMMK